MIGWDYTGLAYFADTWGHILDSERGVERKALFIKLSVKNENNYEHLFLPSGLYLYSIKTENSVMSYRRVLGKNDGGAHSQRD